MINLPVSEAEAFDYLSILQVKLDRGLDCDLRYAEVARDIVEQIPLDVVLESPEYRNLYLANASCFTAIELAHRDKISAAEVQRINHARFLAKRALQERFWPNQPLTERKTLDTPTNNQPHHL